MGRLRNEMTTHFSHPHPLYLTSLTQQQYPSPQNCANCTLPLSSPTTTGILAYTCNPCNFNLHLNCSQMPPLINHPAHPHHPLSLLPVPPYPDASFACKACARRGTGFSYRCAPCGLDLHTLCASAPLSVLCASHCHALSLVFSPPYQNRCFSCDVCGNAGGDHWLYRCGGSCEFDAHIECGTQQQQQQVQQQQQMMQQVQPVVMSRSGSGRGRGIGGGLARKVVQGLVSVASQQIGNKFVPGYGVTAGGVGRGNGDAWSGSSQGGGGWNGGQGSGGGGGGGRSPGGWNGNINGSGRNIDQNYGYGGRSLNNENGGGGSGNWNGSGNGGGGDYSGDGSGSWNGYPNNDGNNGSGGGDNGFGATVMDLGSAVLGIALGQGSGSSSENN